MAFKLKNNPYENVDWGEYEKHIAQFHTHTWPHGDLKPHELVDIYKDRGVSILSITDHTTRHPRTTGQYWGATDDSSPTYPWQNFEDITYYDTENRIPEEENMVAIQGSELSYSHHILSLYNDHTDHKDGEDVSAYPAYREESDIEAVGNKGGLIVFAHPGAHNRLNMGYPFPDWYNHFYQKYKHCIGQEVMTEDKKYNYELAKEKWDSVLSYMSFWRPIWGFANDDLHAIDEGRLMLKAYSIFLLDKLTDSRVRRCMEEGQLYFCYRKVDDVNAVMPDIVNIDVTDRRINIEAENHDEIKWISNGKVVGSGEQFTWVDKNLDDMGLYVRAEIESENGRVYTQPFTFKYYNWINAKF